jgi:serine/threonine protein kinase
MGNNQHAVALIPAPTPHNLHLLHWIFSITRLSCDTGFTTLRAALVARDHPTLMNSALQPAPGSSTRLSLYRNICDAVDRTVATISDENEKQARRFLPKGDLKAILNERALERLFRELLQSTADSPQHSITPSDTNARIDRCIRATIGTPSRVALLALLLYQDRESLLYTFLQWLTSDRTDQLPDISIPFTSEDLYRHGIQNYHRDIIPSQAIFNAVTIQEQEHVQLSNTARLPFLGTPTDRKIGSSGTVETVTIAPKHWEIRSGDHFVVGNPRNPQLVALKTFREIEAVRNMEESTQDFEIECGILQELRRHNIKHDMIMLDSGSITILDTQNQPIRHHLIFERATFSLADFLKDERRASIYTTKSLLLGRLVDIVEALACLHNNLKTLHLDIKPDNILVFEKGSSSWENQNQDQRELVLKLSDFGLARKIDGRKRTGYNSIEPSRSSATPATRPAGIYQGPEIQERNFSQAGRGSDVWSIGCVALMVLAFATGGPAEVSRLTNRLPVAFLGAGGYQSLFYIRSDSHSWESGDVPHYRYTYLEGFNPVTGDIPGPYPQLKAAVNPEVIRWSNILYHNSRQPEQGLIQNWFEVIFRSVLLIDSRARISAAELRDQLRDIQHQWQSYEENPVSEFYDITEPANAPEEPLSHTPSSEENTTGSSVQASSSIYGTSRSSLAEDSRSELTLYSAIRKDDAKAVRRLLENDTQKLQQLCPECNKYPIHVALNHDRFKALEALLENSNTDVTDLACGGRTALQLACSKSDNKALSCISKYADKFRISEEMYNECKKHLGTSEDRILKRFRKKVKKMNT